MGFSFPHSMYFPTCPLYIGEPSWNWLGYFWFCLFDWLLFPAALKDPGKHPSFCITYCCLKVYWQDLGAFSLLSKIYIGTQGLAFLGETTRNILASMSCGK